MSHEVLLNQVHTASILFSGYSINTLQHNSLQKLGRFGRVWCSNSCVRYLRLPGHGLVKPRGGGRLRDSLAMGVLILDEGSRADGYT